MKRQIGTMLHPGAQQREHRTDVCARSTTPRTHTTTSRRQSGHQHGARPQHHLGSSLRLAHTQHIHCPITRQNYLNSLSEKSGEDQPPSVPDLYGS